YYKEWQGQKINYWCYGEEDNQCVNILFTKNDLAEQIIYSVRQEINNCLDFAAFKKQGYTIQETTLDGTAVITNEKLEITLDYPIKLKKGNEEITVNSFHSSITTPLGELYTIAQHIINEEATKANFDVLTWQTNHADVIIIKTKPYPGIIYSIKKSGLTLNFAVEGVDTASNQGEVILASQETNYGCCYVNNNCYANTPSTSCQEKQGSYETAPCTCEEPTELKTNEEELCDGESCQDCGKYEHGESWCDYDSAPGEGKDTVGSRHYLYYCFDGEIYEESCRDYREEICVQSQNKAICRANRWQDCSSCTTEECCENTQARDCYWNEDLNPLETTQCTPTVPVGLKFWEFNGIEICSRANQEKTCNGLNCDQDWVDATAISCYSQADCGNYENTEGVFTEQGFFNSDLKYDPDESVYKTKKTGSLNLPTQIDPQQQLLESPVQETADIFISIITAAYRFVNQWVDITVPNYLNPFTPSPKIEILDISICAPWQAPNSADDCSKCGQNDKTCTEYTCKSLGKKCMYQEDDGYPTCTAIPKEKQTQFHLEIDPEATSSSYIIEETKLEIEETIYHGYKIKPDLTPYKPFTIGIKTTEKSICRLDYTPQAEYLDPPIFMMGKASYQEQHNLTMRVPPKVAIPQKLKDGLNLTTAEEIVGAIVEPKDLLKNYEEKFPAVFNVYKTVTGNELEEELGPYVDKLLDFVDDVEGNYPFYENLSVTLLDKFDSGGYYLFVSCEDQFGNNQEEELFIELNIADTQEDKSPPAILKFMPENNAQISKNAVTTKIYMYTDEPAACRYAYENKQYEEMSYSFTCKNGLYDLTSVAAGSYECTTTLQTDDDVVIYISCADNPNNAESYIVSLQPSTTTAVAGELYSDHIPEDIDNPIEEYAEYINVEQNNATNTTIITATSFLLSDSYPTLFNTSTANNTLNVYINNEMDCTISNKTSTNQMNCTKTMSEEENKGVYICSADVDINNASVDIQNYEINCAEHDQLNINEEAVQYTLKKSDGFEINAVSPRNNEETDENTALTVTTSESKDIVCGYAEYGSIEFIRMTKIADTVFTASLKNLDKGYNTYSIYCKDGYGNSVEGTSTFYVTQ
ncbi:hypothetical protein COV16_00705, partial [Candidatus Woesearchaeota archaeon CG10_big_fil_rev_8_21_14_0_10_34_8]